MGEGFNRSKPYTCWGTNCNARVENITLPDETRVVVDAGTSFAHSCETKKEE